MWTIDAIVSTFGIIYQKWTFVRCVIQYYIANAQSLKINIFYSDLYCGKRMIRLFQYSLLSTPIAFFL